MNLRQGLDRQQIYFLPERLEDYIGPDNPVRFLDAFVDTLDLAALGFVLPKSHPRGRGAPAYPPAAMLKLYISGYRHQGRSSRRLEAEAGRNLELVWLLKKLTPDFKPIADFRKTNAAAFLGVFRQFHQLCRQEELFGGQATALVGPTITPGNEPDPR